VHDPPVDVIPAGARSDDRSRREGPRAWQWWAVEVDEVSGDPGDVGGRATLQVSVVDAEEAAHAGTVVVLQLAPLRCPGAMPDLGFTRGAIEVSDCLAGESGLPKAEQELLSLMDVDPPGRRRHRTRTHGFHRCPRGCR